jgi:hypothetical protein
MAFGAALDDRPARCIADYARGIEARRWLKRVVALGFDETLLVSQTALLEEIKRARDFL